jgi:hypothetical protein
MFHFLCYFSYQCGSLLCGARWGPIFKNFQQSRLCSLPFLFDNVYSQMVCCNPSHLVHFLLIFSARALHHAPLLNFPRSFARKQSILLYDPFQQIRSRHYFLYHRLSLFQTGPDRCGQINQYRASHYGPAHLHRIRYVCSGGE